MKVVFDWQKKGKTTNWIRVQSPNAGTSDAVSKNRGWVFVPEVGDQVMVGYEHGNPDRPYVTGAMFHKDSGKGGDKDNKLKSIITRSGNTILLMMRREVSPLWTRLGNSLLFWMGKIRLISWQRKR